MDEPPAGNERTSKTFSADRGVEADDVREVYRAIFDALLAQIAVVDHTGVITYNPLARGQDYHEP